LSILDDELPLRSLQVTFVGPVPPGEITARAKILRKGRTAIQVQAEIFQGNKVNLSAIGIFGGSRESALRDIPVAAQPAVSLEEAQEIHFVPRMMPDFLQHFSVRAIDMVKLFSGAQHPHASNYSQHLDQQQSWEHLVALADIAPPVAMAALTKFAPASSMNWQLEMVQTIEQLRDHRWFRVDTEMLAGIDGYYWQNTHFYDEDGRLAMLSRQCLAVFG